MNQQVQAMQDELGEKIEQMTRRRNTLTGTEIDTMELTGVDYYLRMLFYFVSIRAAAFLTIFGALPLYFFNPGGLVAWMFIKGICSLWMDLTIEIRGTDKLNNEANSQVIVSNHQSSLDILVMSHLCARKVTMLMRSAFKWAPFVGLASILSNAIFIDTDKNSSRSSMEQASETMVSKQLKVWIFPEGTRNRKQGMLPFKKGAFNLAVQAQVPIVPVVISDLTPFYSKEKRYFRPNGLIICQVLDPIPTEGLTREDVPALCDHVRDEMLKVYAQISEEAKLRYCG